MIGVREDTKEVRGARAPRDGEVETNLLGPIRIPQFTANKGTIVNVPSGLAYVPRPARLRPARPHPTPVSLVAPHLPPG